MSHVLVAVSSNGRNGHSAPGGVGDLALPEYRRNVVMLALFGNTADAQALYFAAPGSSLEGWNYIDRGSAQLKTYLEDGDPPYVRPLTVVDGYQGIPTPQGDCAGDAMPPEARNPEREERETQWFHEKRNGGTHATDAPAAS